MGRHLNEGRRILRARGHAQVMVRDAWHGHSDPGSYDYVGELFSKKVAERTTVKERIVADGEELAKLTAYYADWLFMLHGTCNRIAETEAALRVERSKDPARVTTQDERMLRILAVHLNQRALRDGLNLAIHRMIEEQYAGEAPEARRHARIEMNSGGPGFAWPKAKPVVRPKLPAPSKAKARKKVDAPRPFEYDPRYYERRRIELKVALGLKLTLGEDKALGVAGAPRLMMRKDVEGLFRRFDFGISFDDALSRLSARRLLL